MDMDDFQHLKISDEEKAKRQQAAAGHNQQHSGSFMDKLTGHHSPEPERPPAQPVEALGGEHKDESFKDKVGGAFGGHHKAEPVPARPPPIVEQPKHESFMDKVSHSFSGEQQHSNPPATLAPPPAAPVKSDSFMDKVSHSFSGEHHSTPAAAALSPPPPPVPEKSDSFMDRMSHSFNGDHHAAQPTPPPPPPPEKSDSFMDRMGKQLHHHEEPVPPPLPAKPEGMFHRVSDHVGGGHHEHEVDKKHAGGKEEHNKKVKEEEEKNFFDKMKNRVHPEEPPKELTFKEKINEKLGGGAKSEAEEGKIDKTIDFVQEHVLHQGDQKNEAWHEQQKDKYIADQIRHAVGLEEKEKKEKHKH